MFRIGNTPGIRPGVFVHEDTMGIALEVVELAAAGGPEKDADGGESKDQHAGYEAVDDFHGISGNGFQGLAESRNRVRMRAELPMTASELSGMDTAATSGVTKAAMARGTIMTL